MTDDTLEIVGVVLLQPDDVILLRLPLRVSMEEILSMKTRLQDTFPDRKVLILNHGVELELVREQHPAAAA